MHVTTISWLDGCLEGLVVVRLVKQRHPARASIEHVVHDAALNLPQASWHGATESQRSPPAKKRTPDRLFSNVASAVATESVELTADRPWIATRIGPLGRPQWRDMMSIATDCRVPSARFVRCIDSFVLTLRVFMAMSDSTGHTGQIPELGFLANESSRSMIIQLRQAVAPILANNVFHHFTDHSVSHSDSLCRLVDLLIGPLQNTSQALSDQEQIVLYSACYLHDLGMQYENAGATNVIRQLGLQLRWEELEAGSRLELLRDHHHRISAELVAASVGSATPPIGIQLTAAYRAPQIACLCEAHCVTPTTNRYAELMQDTPGLRMRLLSGLLRLADILDESRHRACREKARTLLLDLESQTHWWRHYYTQDVTIGSRDKAITIWFEFPRDHVDEYERIVPELQLPWIEAELDHHRAAFNEAGIGWTIQTKMTVTPYSNVEQMPDAVLAEMQKQLHRRRIHNEEASREIAVQSFKEAQPLIERRLKLLNDQKTSLSAEDYIDELAKIARDLWDVGSHRSAWMTLAFEFERAYQKLSVVKRVENGSFLLGMLVNDDEPEIARGWVQQLAIDVEAISAGDPRRSRSQQLIAEWYLQMCGYDEAVRAFERAIANSTTPEERASLKSQLWEMHYLQGELRKIIEV
jgi:hypothetical protein